MRLLMTLQKENLDLKGLVAGRIDVEIRVRLLPRLPLQSHRAMN